MQYYFGKVKIAKLEVSKTLTWQRNNCVSLELLLKL